MFDGGARRIEIGSAVAVALTILELIMSELVAKVLYGLFQAVDHFHLIKLCYELSFARNAVNT